MITTTDDKAIDTSEYTVNIKSNELKKLESITIVICIDNMAFWGGQLEALIDEINQICQSDNCKLKQVNFVDTTYLNRHYDNTIVDPINSNWKMENSKYIDKLVIKHNIIDWITYLNNENYSKFQIEIENDYFTNRDGFKDICDKFSQNFAHKNGLEAAKKYFLEESIAFRIKTGCILYPGSLKDPFEWIMNHYTDTKVTILPYSVRKSKNKKTSEVKVKNEKTNTKNWAMTTSYQPSFFGQTIAAFAEDLTGDNIQKQRIFMKKFTELCDEFSNSSSDEEENKARNNVVNFIK